MTKNEQIDEIADIINCSWNTKSASSALYNAGYRKIDDDCAVITKAELGLYRRQSLKEFAEMLKECAKSCKESGYDGINEEDIDLILKEYEK